MVISGWGKRGFSMQRKKGAKLFFKFTTKGRPFRTIISIMLVSLVFAAMITPLYAQLTPARDLTGTWKSGVPGMYYSMDPSDGTKRMDDITATFQMDITQRGSDIQIVFYTYASSWKTDPAYWNEWGMNGVPPVNGGDILFVGTVSGASFSADEYPASSSTREHLEGTFTTDIITATLTGLLETSDTNGIIVLREGSTATIPPTATPAPIPALPTSTNLGTVSKVQGSASFVDTGSAVTTQSQIGTGAEIQTGSNTVVGFDYPDQGGTVYLGGNSHAAWVYLAPQTDPATGHIDYMVVPSPITGSVPFEEGLEADEFGQIAVTLPIEIGIGILLLGETLPIALTGAAVVEGTLLLGTGIAYIHEQLSPQEGTCDVRPIQVPQGLVMGSGTDYVVTVSDQSTTIQVIDGSVIFVDQNTNSTITVTANQMLTLPLGVAAGFSQQDLQGKVSAFDASQINQWWTQTAATVTPQPPTAIPATATPKPTFSTGVTGIFSQPAFLAAIILVIVMVVIAVLLVLRRKKGTKQPRLKTRSKKMPQPVKYENPNAAAPTPNAAQKSVFCPNCGNQLLYTQGTCPFCGVDLNQYYPNIKK
jgi:hypothetical protein